MNEIKFVDRLYEYVVRPEIVELYLDIKALFVVIVIVKGNQSVEIVSVFV